MVHVPVVPTAEMDGLSLYTGYAANGEPAGQALCSEGLTDPLWTDKKFVDRSIVNALTPVNRLFGHGRSVAYLPVLGTGWLLGVHGHGFPVPLPVKEPSLAGRAFLNGMSAFS